LGSTSSTETFWKPSPALMPSQIDSRIASMDGVSVSHYTGDVDAGKMSGGAAVPGMPSLGTTSLWIDPQTKFLHKLSMDVDLGGAFKAMSDMAQALAGTPTPGGETATPIPSMKFKVEMTISKQNDPSLSVPTP